MCHSYIKYYLRKKPKILGAKKIAFKISTVPVPRTRKAAILVIGLSDNGMPDDVKFTDDYRTSLVAQLLLSWKFVS